MAITEDSSAPAAVHSSTTSGTTGSFSPPANSLLVVMVAVDGASSGATTVSLSDSGSHTWTLGKRQNTNVNSAPVVGGSAEVWLCQLTTAPGSITVTASWSTGSGAAGGNVVTKVLLGASASQTGAATGGAGGGNIAPTCTLTPTVVGSHVYGAILDFATNATLTANAQSTIIDQFLDASNGDTWGTYKGSADTTALSSTTFGATNANSAFNVAALEILPVPTGQGSISQSFHPGKGPSNRGRFFQTQKNAYRFENDVAVTEALGTGTANNANVIIAPAPTAATGTGTANNANASILVNATEALGTGTAYDATVTAVSGSPAGQGIVSSQLHPGRGPSNKARFFQTQKNAYRFENDVAVTEALGTGTANNANVIVAPNATAAIGTGTANDANASIAPASSAALGTGTANSPTTAIVVNPTTASGAGTANNPNANVAPAPSAASATGTANDANVSIVVNGASALGTGTAYDAVVGGAAIVGSAPGIATHPGKGPSNRGRFVQRPGGFTIPSTNAPATEALATGTAFNPSVAIVVNPSAPVGTGTAYDASISIAVSATVALGTGSVSAATANVGSAALAAAAIASANQALAALRVNPSAATGAGTANNVASGFNAFVNAQSALASALPNGLWTARPKTSTTSRPSSGTTTRPGSGTTSRPSSGTTLRPYTGITIDPG